MKKFLSVLFVFQVLLLMAKPAGEIPPSEIKDHNWKKDSDGAWKGERDGKSYWYRLKKNRKLTISENGRSFRNLGSGMWPDKAGRMLMISESRLIWTLDEGKTWIHVPDWCWEGSDGKWYKFDKEWVLWVSDI